MIIIVALLLRHRGQFGSLPRGMEVFWWKLIGSVRKLRGRDGGHQE